MRTPFVFRTAVQPTHCLQLIFQMLQDQDDVCSQQHATFRRITTTMLNRTSDRWGVETKSKYLPHVNKRQELGTISRLEKWLLDTPL